MFNWTHSCQRQSRLAIKTKEVLRFKWVGGGGGKFMWKRKRLMAIIWIDAKKWTKPKITNERNVGGKDHVFECKEYGSHFIRDHHSFESFLSHQLTHPSSSIKCFYHRNFPFHLLPAIAMSARAIVCVIVQWWTFKTVTTDSTQLREMLGSVTTLAKIMQQVAVVQWYLPVNMRSASITPRDYFTFNFLRLPASAVNTQCAHCWST